MNIKSGLRVLIALVVAAAVFNYAGKKIQDQVNAWFPAPAAPLVDGMAWLKDSVDWMVAVLAGIATFVLLSRVKALN